MLSTGSELIGIEYGRGGWVRISDPQAPGLWLYLRLRETRGGRWQTCEVYLDARARVITAELLRRVPKIAELVEARIEPAEIERDATSPGPDLSRLASYFQRGFGKTGQHWVGDSFLAQDSASGVKQPPYDGRAAKAPARDDDARLYPSNDARVELTDDFLSDVANAYRAAIARGEQPNVALSAQAERPQKTVQRWIAESRRRGFLQPARKQGARP